MSNITFGLAELNSSAFQLNRQLDAREFYLSYCSQFNNYFLKIGLIILISYALIHWFNWWFFNKGYKLLDDELRTKNKLIGNLDDIETRIFWDIWLKSKLMKVMAGFIAVIAYLSYSG
ncbi:MAG: hypothetical protein PHQ60_16335 [Sideroxydans sp.]|nr:hypothetical protein [Sideroxydans sp.]